jgi:hypothetical protein
MTYIKIPVPDLEQLKENLKDESWVAYYRKSDSFVGPIKSIVYLLDFLKNNKK